MWKCLLKMHVHDGPVESTVHHMQLITVYLRRILSEHPDEPKSLPYCHSVKMALTETTWMYQAPAQTTLKRSWSSGPVPPQPHLCPAVGVSSSIIWHPKTPVCRLQSDQAALKERGLALKRRDLSLSLKATQWASVKLQGPLLHLQNKSVLFSSSICVHSAISHFTRERSREDLQLFNQK